MRIVKKILIILILIISSILVLVWFFSEPHPEGREGPAADALAQQMMQAIGHSHWENTLAIRWNFDNRRQHLWDRRRHFARVQWKDYNVLVNINARDGIAWQNGRQLRGDEAGRVIELAWKYWANDSFWLNPVSKSFDDGVRREIVEVDGQTALLVTFGQGGATPGDAYLWFSDNLGLPQRWQMWVSILPIKGLSATWQDWQTLSTGVKIATRHQIFIKELILSDIQGAVTLSELLPEGDPFDALPEGPGP